jgi:hypothetical protein
MHAYLPAYLALGRDRNGYQQHHTFGYDTGRISSFLEMPGFCGAIRRAGCTDRGVCVLRCDVQPYCGDAVDWDVDWRAGRGAGCRMELDGECLCHSGRLSLWWD